jgi:hypothetical protein
MRGVRLAASLLIVALAAPPVAALACDWVCAAKHRTVAAEGHCHGHEAPGSDAKFSAGHDCHQPGELALSRLTSAPQAAEPLSIVESAPTGSFGLRSNAGPRRPDRSHAPPPTILPLRI